MGSLDTPLDQEIVADQTACEEGLPGAFCPGETCREHNDCASMCCLTANSCGMEAECGLDVDGFPWWGTAMFVSFVVLMIIITILVVNWLKRRHREELRQAGEGDLTKDLI